MCTAAYLTPPVPVPVTESLAFAKWRLPFAPVVADVHRLSPGGAKGILRSHDACYPGRVSMVNSRKLQKYVAYTIGLENPRVAIHQHKNGENNVAFPIACKPSWW